jgi:putative membrane protein
MATRGFGLLSGTDRRVGIRAGVGLILTVAVFVALAVVFPSEAYLWIKALHVLAVISWMAGLLYLPRLFVNHVGLPMGSAESDLLKGMEARLLRIIMTPAMLLSWIAGLWLAYIGFRFQGGWLHLKLLGVVGLTVAHFYFAQSARRFQLDENRHTARFWRMVNEIPALLMILVVVLVIVKPFA